MRLKFWNKYDPPTYWEERGAKHKGDAIGGLQHEDVVKNVIPPFMKAIEELKFDRVLDVGCGYGRFLKELELHYPQTGVVGVDISKSELENAKEYLGDDTRAMLIHFDGSHLPFLDKEFDLVFCSNVLLHVPPSNIDQLRSEMARVSSKYVILVEPAKAGGAHYMFDHKDHITFFRICGFDLVEKKPFLRWDNNKELNNKQYIYIFRRRT